MVLGKPVPDKTLLRSVTQKISQRSGGSGSKVVASVNGGVVTLTGVLGQEYQRRPLLSSMSGISGVRRTVDQMTVAPPKKREQ
ncbi:BON domain-containing protein [Aureliella helgolandensis]|uniref:BON domain protein n=1 Tax=Aureliella helgolandensis TaxID=2527968 RepID=A0A518GHP7_9BACT|nr:BON domain-containing protein [Aureliella helgolandensis]QDV28116.1 BON domain protein [Aureliella helgolandensis]|tara:strand:+ start:413 stop:661 length:249 start_codon:yes stop_codon:yes gene_type:complete